MGAMPSRSHRRLGAAAAVAAVAVGGALLVPGASADVASDTNAMFKDYRSDSDITNCRFTKKQLQAVSASLATGGDVDQYSPDFGAEVKREIKRWSDGGCRTASIAATTLGKLKVTKSGSTYRVRTGANISCPVGGKTCKVRIAATARGTKVASTSFSVKATRTRAISFKLNRTGAAKLKSAGKLAVKVTTSVKNGKRSTKKTIAYTLKRPK